MAKSVKKDYHAAGDFVDTLTDAHVLALVMQELNISDMTEESKVLPENCEEMTLEDKKQYLTDLIGGIVDKYLIQSLSSTIDQTADSSTMPAECSQDGIFNYASNFLKLGLLRRINILATRAGDGNRLLRHWKFAFLIYFSNRNINYQLEAFLFLASVQALLTPRLSHQLLWNRYDNDNLIIFNLSVS